eukprot:TRINITY_DN93923_c0_g1_i1.p1 TRINITY_DN93923_c0_g1~~TRINITY_DN93923_c0_g1_i1.p1  ORF type:complete len:202 (+),score=70.57 TRINITY_DN93923_c0_g1_i1:113-718(+)
MANEEEAAQPAAPAEGEVDGPKGNVGASIAEKGENSYYFAHARAKEDLSEAKRITGDGSRRLADLDGGPAKLEQADEWLSTVNAEKGESDKVRWREDYAYGDEGEKVKLYVEFAEGALKDAKIATKFEDDSFEVVVSGLPSGSEGVRNGNSSLHGSIVGAKCSTRVNSSKSRLTITLVKKDKEEPWPNLKKKSINQHTGWN